MDIQAFIVRIRETVEVDEVWPNPGGKTSTIVRLGDNVIVYRRGNTNISVNYEDLHAVLSKYAGEFVTSSEVRDWRPDVFDSSAGGHSCNRTFLFLLLKKLGVVKRIDGSGVRGDPFGVQL
jgi:hypothetical protein